VIPARLALRNFMCYRDNVPPLDFTGIHLACLCGNNGNGKSALLDAITWALWGKARGHSDDDLVNLGQTEMEVEFEFEVRAVLRPFDGLRAAQAQDVLRQAQDVLPQAQDGSPQQGSGQRPSASLGVSSAERSGRRPSTGSGQRYRVIRKHSKPTRPGASGRTVLELQVASEDGFRPITGNSVRETQQKLDQILRLDYKTFINSAFLIQGGADKFTRSDPRERKEILGRILGLSLYDELEAMAREQRRDRENEHRSLESSLAEIDRELARKDGYQTERGQVKEALATLEPEVARQEAALAASREARKALEVKREQCAEIERRLEQARVQLQVLKGQGGQQRSLVDKYEKALASYGGEAAKVAAGLAEVAAQEEKLARARQQAEELSGSSRHLREANQRLKAEMEELAEKLKLLKQGDALCPLCGAELGVEGRQRIMASYQAEGQSKGEAYRSNEREARQAEQALAGLRREMGTLEQGIRVERTRWEAKRQFLERDRAEAEGSLPQAREGLRCLEEAVAAWHQTMASEEAARGALASELADYGRVSAEVERVERAYQQLREEQRALRDRQAAIEERLRRCAELEEVRREKAGALRKAAEERDIFRDLAEAFGKRGVQALIIEQVIPELEEEANRLLARMTDNRMHLKIETQRAYKVKKGEEETLLITISDELGTRDYEMYSGGEAFRVDFALRIALSKLLARRAGAPLPTLFIDEGFGTQDSSGREKLVEAINSIQDDFEKIIVITHLDELKDLFPVRIEVTKTAEGSTITVS